MSGACFTPSLGDLPDCRCCMSKGLFPHLLRIDGALAIRDWRVPRFVALVHGLRLIHLALLGVVCFRLGAGIGISPSPTLSWMPLEGDRGAEFPSPCRLFSPPSVLLFPECRGGRGLTRLRHSVSGRPCRRRCRLWRGCCGISALGVSFGSLQRTWHATMAVSKHAARGMPA